MTLGTALFASVVLVLAVFHKPFRIIFFWVAGISAIGAGIFFLSVHLYHRHETAQRAEADRQIKACIDRFPVPYIEPDGERMSVSAVASTCARNPAFAPNANSSNAARVVEVRGGATLHINPPQQFSPEGDPDVIPVIYLGHRQSFVLTCGYYGEQKAASVSLNQGLVSCPDSAPPECVQTDEKQKPAKWGNYIVLSLRDCTKDGCVVYNGKRVVGGITRNEITSAQWDSCG